MFLFQLFQILPFWNAGLNGVYCYPLNILVHRGRDSFGQQQE